MTTSKFARLHISIAVLLFVNALPSASQIFKAPGVSYASGGFLTRSVAVADLNGDGKLDLVVTNCGPAAIPGCGVGTVGVLLGNGDGTFQPAVTYGSGGQAWSVAVADVNRDGKPDLIVANFASSTVAVLLGKGDGTFQPAVTYDSGASYASSVAVADVNGDGKPDLVVVNSLAPGTLGVLLGKGDGTFQAAVPYNTRIGLAVVVADVNGDGKADLLVANQCGAENFCAGNGSVGVLLGNGDGTFQPEVIYDSGGAVAQNLAVADVNGDGIPDVVVVDAGACTPPCGPIASSVAVLLGKGDGTFQPAVPYDSGGQYAESVAVADVNGDGKPDLVVEEYASDRPTRSHPGGIGVLLGNGDGTFQAALPYRAGGSSASSAVVADVNGDGKPDVVVAVGCAAECNQGGGVEVMLGLPAKTTTKVATSGSPSLVGHPVTFTATITSPDGQVPNGKIVTFYDGADVIGTGTTASGVAALTTSSLAPGGQIIKASFPSDVFFKASSGTVREIVQKVAASD